MTLRTTIPLQSAKDLRTAVAAAPDELYIEVTNRCNLKCHTCPQFFGMGEAFHTLEWDRFVALVNQVPSLRRVVLHGIGEPLMNAELPRMVRYLKARGAYVLFNSNGLLLRGQKARDLATSGLDELRVSIDGGTPATYKKVRGIDGFDRILRNLDAFAASKRALGVTDPRVSLWVTLLRSNVADLPELVRVAAQHQVPEVYLQRLVYSERGLATLEESLWSRATESDLAAVAEAERLAVELGVTLRGSGELGVGVVEAGREADPAPWRGCHRPWRLMYVTANGNVLPCCIAPFTEAPYQEIVLGNLNSNTLDEVWNGERYGAWRLAMLEGEPPAACKSCGSNWSL